MVVFDEWKRFFTGLSTDDLTKGYWRTRAFGDGGYLDNKPFSYVVESLSLRIGSLPMERKLIYVEPSPLHPETERNGFEAKPNAVENAFDALLSILTDETIRKTSKRYWPATGVSNASTGSFVRSKRRSRSAVMIPSRASCSENGTVPKWRSRDMRDMVNYYGAAFLPYRQLRVMTVTDGIADRLAAWWGIDDQSDRLYALRAMARVWRDARITSRTRPTRGPRIRPSPQMRFSKTTI